MWYPPYKNPFFILKQRKWPWQDSNELLRQWDSVRWTLPTMSECIPRSPVKCICSNDLCQLHHLHTYHSTYCLICITPSKMSPNPPFPSNNTWPFMQLPHTFVLREKNMALPLGKGGTNKDAPLLLYLYMRLIIHSVIYFIILSTYPISVCRPNSWNIYISFQFRIL